tara:strand:+ start:1930 stop:2481 length:552 start_codon:yes stop_codon:yes gene_type:complete
MGAVNVELDVLIEKVINWHTQRYPELLSNSPSEQSFASIRLLCEKILLPVQIEFGQVNVTYGFTSASLVNLIRKKCPAGTAPKLDQHAAHECNKNNVYYCNRLGAACDFLVAHPLVGMDEIANWITQNVEFDRLYFYGVDKPLHISYGPENSKFVQLMGESEKGRRIPKQRASYKSFNSLLKQ